MIDLRFRLPLRAASAALLLSLAACGEGITTPRELAGHWQVVETFGPQQQYRVEDRLELREDGGYTWTSATFAPIGRAPDGLETWAIRMGSWRVEGDQLALRTASGMAWDHGGGWSQVDYAAEWRRGHRLRTKDGRMILEEQLPPEYSRSPRTYVFVRVAGFDDAPPPPDGPWIRNQRSLPRDWP